MDMQSWMNEDSTFMGGIIEVVDMLAGLFDYVSKVYIKDTQGRYVYISDSYAVLMGIDVKTSIGKTDYDLELFPETDFVTLGQMEDHEVMQKHQLISFLKIYPYASGVEPLLFNKANLFNKRTNKSVGIIVRVLDTQLKNLTPKILKAYNLQLGAKTLSKRNLDFNLTAREKQIIFLFLANFTSSDIAKIIGKIEGKAVSKSYIDNVFNEQLYLKFNVNDRKALFDKLIHLGFEDIIPDKLLKYCSIRLS